MLKEIFELNPLFDLNLTARLNKEGTITVSVQPKDPKGVVNFPAFTATNKQEAIEEEIVEFFKKRVTTINDKLVIENTTEDFDKALEETEKAKAPAKPKAATKTATKKAEPKVEEKKASLLDDVAPKVNEVIKEPVADNTPIAELLQTAQVVAPKEDDANVQGLIDSKPKFDF